MSSVAIFCSRTLPAINDTIELTWAELLLIAGEAGLELDDVLARADEQWSLGPLTLPHMLVRLVLAEQLYRAAALLCLLISATLAWVALAVALGLTGGAVAAEPAQVPLSSRVAEPPTPNVLVTVDDSGSMLADYVPEGNLTLNGWTGSLSSQWVAAFPGDWRKMCSDGSSGCVAVPKGWKWPYDQYSEGVAISLKGSENNYQRRFRSPDVNKIFYNPDVRYQPWWKPDGSGRMANADPKAARLDPTVNSTTFDLTVTQTGKTRWYTATNTYVEESKDFYPGLVYRLKAGETVSHHH